MEINEIVSQLEKTLADKMAAVEAGRASKADVEQIQKSLDAVSKKMDKFTVNETPLTKSIFKTEGDRDAFASVFAKGLRDTGILNKMPEGGVKSFWLQKANLDAHTQYQGAEWVPTTIDSYMNKIIMAQGVARQNCRVISGIRGVLNLSARNVAVTVGPADTTDNFDGIASPVAASSYTTAVLTPKEASGMTKVSEKLIFDSPFSAIEQAATDLSEAASIFEDKLVFVGDGTKNFFDTYGVKSLSTVPSTTPTVAQFTATPIQYALALRAATNFNVAVTKTSKSYMHPAIFAAMQTQVGSGSGLFVFDPATAQYMLGGQPIELVYAMDSTIATGKCPVVFGDLSKAWALGLGRELDVRVLDQVFAATNNVGVRLTYDVGACAPIPTAVGKIILAS